MQNVYAFDGYGQLVSSTGSIGGNQSDVHTITWTYDCAGNRLTETGAMPVPTNPTAYSTNYASNSLNQYSSVTGTPQGEGSPSYDADGNLIQDATWTYGYDCENRLVSMSKSGQSLSFKYDYMGRRIEKIVTGTNASDTKYVWSGWTLVAELSADGARVNRSFIYGGDFSDAQGGAGGAGALLAQNDHGTLSYAMPDALGNIVGYVSAAGSLTAAVEYSPYGRAISTAQSYTSYPVGYSGQYTDWETGLVYYGHRYYMPKHGRFINRDPIEEQGGYNLYAFCLNGPVFRWDVLGNVLLDPIALSTQTDWESDTHSTTWLDPLTGDYSAQWGLGFGVTSMGGNPDGTGTLVLDSGAPTSNTGDFSNFQTDVSQSSGSYSGIILPSSLGSGSSSSGNPISDAPNNAASGGGLTFGEAVSAAVTGALGGAAGFANTLTLGAFPTAGFDQSSVHTGQMVGVATAGAVLGLATAGAADAAIGAFTAVGTPAFYSGMSAAAAGTAAAARGGYVLANTPAGQWLNNTFQPAVLSRLGTDLGGSLMNGVWTGASGVYATASALTSPTALYFGTGQGMMWINVEAPILNAGGVTVTHFP